MAHAVSDPRDRFVGFAFAAADLLLEIGADRRLTFAAGAFRERMGQDPVHFHGLPVAELIAPEDRGRLEIALSLLAARGRLAPVSLRLSNEQRTLVALAGLCLPDNQGVSWLTVSRMPARPPDGPALATAPVLRAAVETRLSSDVACDIGLIEITGWAKLADGQRRELESDIASTLRDAGGTGALAADFSDGKFGLLGSNRLDMTDVQKRIASVMSSAGAARQVTGAAIPLSGGDAAPKEALRAIRYALSRFSSSGTAGVREAGFDRGLTYFLHNTSARASAVQAALERGRFKLVFQPVVALADRKPHHYEALLRPFPIDGHPIGSTQDFVTFAEAMGLAECLDGAVLDRAVEGLRGARAKVAINVSGLSMQSGHFREKLFAAIGAEASLREQLLVELTETADIDNVPAAAETIRGLNAAGVAVCLDDFGTGHAAFRYLREFKVQFVKIDGSFVRPSAKAGQEGGFVGAMVDLARHVGAQTIAEEIETEMQAAAMKEQGVKFGQGWLFGKPGALPGSL